MEQLDEVNHLLRSFSEFRAWLVPDSWAVATLLGSLEELASIATSSNSSLP